MIVRQLAQLQRDNGAGLPRIQASRWPLVPYRLELLFAFLRASGRVEPDFLRAFLLSA